MQQEEEYIKQLSTKTGVSAKQLAQSLKTGEWSKPIRNFPLDSKGSKTADTVIRLSKDQQGRLNVEMSPLQKFKKAEVLDIDDLNIPGKKPTVKDAGNDFSIKVGKTQLTGTVLDDNGKAKIQIEGYYGPNPILERTIKSKNDPSLNSEQTTNKAQQKVDDLKEKNLKSIHNPEFEKLLNDLKNKQDVKLDDKITLNEQQLQQKLSPPKDVQMKTTPNVDPVIQTQLLINNLALLVKLGLPRPHIDIDTQQNIDNELNKTFMN